MCCTCICIIPWHARVNLPVASQTVLQAVKWDFTMNRKQGGLKHYTIKGKDHCVLNSQMPRYDLHLQIDFRKSENEDAELLLEVWDWDKRGDDDLISRVVLDSLDIRERCCTTIANRKQGKFYLTAKPGASKAEAKWGVGNLTLQFKLVDDVDYCAEAQKKAFGRTRKSYISEKIRGAREDFAV